MTINKELFKNILPDKDFISNIFSFDINRLSTITSLDVSKFVIALSQYLIYFKFEFNNTKMLLQQKKHLLEASITQLMTDELVKAHKTKKDTRFYLIHNNPVLNKLHLEAEALNDEVVLLEGIDKTISELIAAFKRELTRRENELYQGKHS